MQFFLIAKRKWNFLVAGHLPLIFIRISLKPNYSVSGDWDSGIQNITTGSEESSISLRGLRPARTYFCRVRAENSVGLGDPSEAVTVVTVEEGKHCFLFIVNIAEPRVAFKFTLNVTQGCLKETRRQKTYLHIGKNYAVYKEA